jgi:hypothetical protein
VAWRHGPIVFPLQPERAQRRRLWPRNRSAPPTCRREDLVASDLHKVSAEVLEPLGRPLPNCGCFGGLPIFCGVPFAVFRFPTMAFLLETLVCQTLKIKFRFGVHCLEAVHLIEPAHNDIGVVAIDFNAVAPPSGLFGCDQGRTTPRQTSRMIPLRLEQSRIGSATSATGFTVGCMATSVPRSLPTPG